MINQKLNAVFKHINYSNCQCCDVVLILIVKTVDKVNKRLFAIFKIKKNFVLGA
jgi:hypothetical protein